MKTPISIIVFTILLLVCPTPANAGIAYGGGEYTNLCGSGTAADQYACVANCDPGQGSCAGSNNGVVKWTCDGRVDDCTNLGGESTWENTQNFSGAQCGKTYQIDVFDKNCRAAGGGAGQWAPDCQLLGYMVWYSGDCPNQPPSCNPGALNMSVTPQAVQKGNTVQYVASGSEGSLYIDDSWSGGVNCTGAFWGTKTCTATSQGTYQWSHFWRSCNGDPSNLANCSPVCQKSTSYIIIDPTPTPTPTPPPGKIVIKPVQLISLNPDCSSIVGADPLPGASFAISPASGNLQVGANSVHAWENISIVGREYGVRATAPLGFQPVKACYVLDGVLRQGESAVLEPGKTITWYVVFRPNADAWFQTKGGDVYSGDSIKSPIYDADTEEPRVFNLNLASGKNGTSGVVVYKSSADFQAGSSLGHQYVAQSANYLVRTSSLVGSIDLFASFYQKLTSQKSVITPSGMMPSCAGATCVFYTRGDVNIDSLWSVPAGKKIIMLIDENAGSGGNVHIGATGGVRVSPGGFIAFITRRDIDFTQNPSSATSPIQGVFIAGENMYTGDSPTSPQFYAKGIFISGGNIVLKRNIGETLSTSMASEVFEYDPNLLMNMPEEMMDFPITWEEVAP